MDALPVEVREALERMPAVDGGMGIVFSCAIADTGLAIGPAMVKGRYDYALERATKLAAASIRLVEYIKQCRL